LRSAKKEFKAARSYAKDVLLNIAGFVPLGLIACAYFSWTRSRWKAILIAITACGALSFVIEVLQYYIPPRFSGTTDILTNTLGAAVGAALIRSGAVRQALKETKLIRS
jgi:VanZ family protein